MRYDIWRLIFISIKNRHPSWSNKRIANCTKFVYRKIIPKLKGEKTK